MKKAIIVPDSDIENCKYCAQAGGAFSMSCRGCVVRWCSRLPRNYRMKVYEGCRPEALAKFKIDVKKIWAAERASFEAARAEAGKLGILKAKSNL